MTSLRQSWGHRVAVVIDTAVNVVFGGTADITISSSAALAKAKGKRWGCVLCRFLNVFEKDHCDKALEADLARASKAIQLINEVKTT